MTIKEKIDAYVLAQGNQVGAGAELASLLKEIVDSIPSEYTLPPASAQTLGGIKVGENLSITEQGVLSASGGGSGAIIVEGTINNNFFTPNSGQPTKADAIEALNSGRMVIIKTPSEEDETKWDWRSLVFFYEYDGAFSFSGDIAWD
jgi:hypothetical protein